MGAGLSSLIETESNKNFSRASSRCILYDLFLPYCNINLQKTDDKKLMFKKIFRFTMSSFKGMNV